MARQPRITMKLGFQPPPRMGTRRATFRFYTIEWEELKTIIAVQQLRVNRVRVPEIARLLRIEESIVRCYLRRRGLPPVPDRVEAAVIGETITAGTVAHLNEVVTVSAQVVRATKWEGALNPRFHKLPVIRVTAERFDAPPPRRRRPRVVRAGPN